MRRPRRRPMHYTAHTLHDGTVLAAYPIRKPSPPVIRRDGLKIDEDGIAVVFADTGRELRDHRNESRMRFQNIIATNLNTRRAIRELVLKPLEDLRREVVMLREEVERLRTGTGGE